MIILASNSPRRKELLQREKIDFIVEVAETNEVFDPQKKLDEALLEVAYNKAKPVFLKHSNDTVIAADTIVYCDNVILGKPKNLIDAKRMLLFLSNKTHQVLTGVVILNKKQTIKWVEKTNVTFKKLTDLEIETYINNFNVLDKAGSYAIQEGASIFVKDIKGDYDNIVGLPVKKVVEILKSNIN